MIIARRLQAFSIVVGTAMRVAGRRAARVSRGRKSHDEPEFQSNRIIGVCTFHLRHRGICRCGNNTRRAGSPQRNDARMCPGMLGLSATVRLVRCTLWLSIGRGKTRTSDDAHVLSGLCHRLHCRCTGRCTRRPIFKSNLRCVCRGVCPVWQRMSEIRRRRKDAKVCSGMRQV